MAGRKATPRANPKGKRPIMPRDLEGNRRKFWQLIVPMLTEMNYLQKIDRPALVMMCDSWAHYQDLEEKMRSEKYTSKTTKGNVIQHPLVSARNAVYKQLVGMMNEFGMTPAARVKMTHVPAQAANQGDLFPDRKRKPVPGAVPQAVTDAMGGGAVGSA